MGGIPRRRNFNRVWKKALKAAEIPTEMDLHLHDLRHSGRPGRREAGPPSKS